MSTLENVEQCVAMNMNKKSGQAKICGKLKASSIIYIWQYKCAFANNCDGYCDSVVCECGRDGVISATFGGGGGSSDGSGRGCCGSHGRSSNGGGSGGGGRISPGSL